MNRLARAATATALALALASCATTTAGIGRVATDATVPGGRTGTTPTPDPSAPASTSGQPVTLGKATIPLTGVAKSSRDGDHLCLTLANDTGCSLEIIDIGATRAAGGAVTNPAPGEQNGWWWGPGAPSCGSGNEASPVTGSTVVQKGFKPVGPKNAAYGYWKVTCQNPALDFDPRLWWLPTSMVAFRERSTAAGAAEAVDKLLAGVTFGG